MFVYEKSNVQKQLWDLGKVVKLSRGIVLMIWIWIEHSMNIVLLAQILEY